MIVIPGQVVSPDVEQMLCSGSVPIARLIGLGLVIASFYFILMFVVRMMREMDAHGTVPHTRSAELNTLKKGRHSRLAARDGLFYLTGVLLPFFYPVLLAVMGINVPACLFPPF